MLFPPCKPLTHTDSLTHALAHPCARSGTHARARSGTRAHTLARGHFHVQAFVHSLGSCARSHSSLTHSLNALLVCLLTHTQWLANVLAHSLVHLMSC